MQPAPIPDSTMYPVRLPLETTASPAAPPADSAASAVAPPQSQQGEPPTSSEVEDGWSPRWRECSLSPLSSTWSVAAPDPGMWLTVAGIGEALGL